MKDKLWGGAFSKETDERAWTFGQSVTTDATMWAEELQVSIAHVRMLGSTGVLTEHDAIRIEDGLEQIYAEFLERYKSSEDPASLLKEPVANAEDIHSAIETLLKEKIGDVAGRLHAGRSRNDQVATVTRLWLKNRSDQLIDSIKNVQYTICGLAERYADASMPGFTHTQPAQPLTLGFHLMAYFWMLQRDVMRISALRLQECPLGAGAVAGTSLPVSREMTAKNLGFAGPMPNALDATSDRDFIGDALHTCATLMQHLSRFSHELVFWSNPLIGFVKLDESLTTGSSIMPQKRNPDMAELIRGRAARVIGHWTGFMSMMKGLPLGYNRDQQEDKPPLFDSFRLCFDSLYLCLAMIETAEFNVKRMAEVAGDGFSTATGVAEALVMDGMPFRQAHEVTGSLVRQCEAQGIALHQLKVDDARLQAILLSATVGASIASRNGHGGPGPDAMKAQLEEAKACLMAKDLKEG